MKPLGNALLDMTDTIDTSMPAATDSSGVAVLDRAFALLAAFEPADEQLTLTELSKRTGLYKSTVLRILGALEHGGFIRKLRDGTYSIGPQPLRLATIYQRSFRVGHVVEPLLKQLSAASGETASFYVRHGVMRIALFRSEPYRAVRASVSTGTEYPIGQGASGKVLLAFSQPPLVGYEVVRERLWAVSYGERDPDTASVSVPVFGVTGELQGALAISGPRQRLAPPLAMFAACLQVLNIASEATSTLGGDVSRYGRALEQASLDQFDQTSSRR